MQINKRIFNCNPSNQEEKKQCHYKKKRIIWSTDYSHRVDMQQVIKLQTENLD